MLPVQGRSKDFREGCAEYARAQKIGHVYLRNGKVDVQIITENVRSDGS